MRVYRYARQFFRYGLISLGTLLVVLLLLTAAVYYIAVSDQERVPAWVEDYSQEELGVQATFAHYRFQYFKHFPFLSLALEDVVVQAPDSVTTHTELLRIKEIDIVFRPWKLLQEQYELRSIRIDTARLQLYRNAEGQFNADALQLDSTGIDTDSSQLLNGLFQLDAFDINGFYVDFLDSLRRKHHRLELLKTQVLLRTSDTARHVALKGNWKFHGLVFKMKNGPFFRQQRANVDLEFAFPFAEQQAILHPSTIELATDTLAISGYYHTEPPGFLRLDIQTDNLLLAEAKPLLANNLQEALTPYQIDRPLQVKLKIAGATPPGERQPIELDIEGKQLTLATNTLRFTTPKLQAHYRNDCDSSGTITPYTDCLRVALDSALLFDTIPVRDLVYFDENLQHPHATFSGRTEVALSKLNAYLPQEQIRLYDGWIEMAFQFAGQPNDLIDPAIKELRPQFSATGKIHRARGEHLPSRTRFEQGNFAFSLDPRKLYLHQANITVNEQKLRFKGPVYGLPALLFSKPSTPFAKLQLSAGNLQVDQLIPSGSASAGAGFSSFPFRLALDFSADALAYRKLRLHQPRFRATLRNPCPPGDTCLRINQIEGKAYRQLPIRGRAAITAWPQPEAD
ncbi:MAG: AsmA family protein, partial [Bacteroidetes bacterium]|nr:AsmA family protein [Bacteroidota bacterium]